jgi:hypothetical protein
MKAHVTKVRLARSRWLRRAKFRRASNPTVPRTRERNSPRLDARLLGAVRHLTDGSYGTPAASEANTAERKKRLLITAQMNTWVFCA